MSAPKPTDAQTRRTHLQGEYRMRSLPALSRHKSRLLAWVVPFALKLNAAISRTVFIRSVSGGDITDFLMDGTLNGKH